MKYKILSIAVIILAVIFSIDVYAFDFDGYFYESEKIDGIYFYKHREDTETEKYQYHNFHSQASIYRNSRTNNFVYCVESWVPISGATGGDYEDCATSSFLEWDAKLRVEALAYYGYGYKEGIYDHTDPKWYAITQYLIWQVTNPNIEHYFVSSISSKTPIYPYENEIAELNYLVRENQQLPDFNVENKTLLLGETKVIEDKLGILPSFNLYTGDDISKLNVEVLNEKSIAIKANEVGEHELVYYRKFNYYDDYYRYYRSDKYQNVFEPGNMSTAVLIDHYNVIGGSIKYTSTIEEEGNKRPSLTNVSLYRASDDTLVETKSTDENGSVLFTDLFVGEYYVCEEQNLDGYTSTEIENMIINFDTPDVMAIAVHKLNKKDDLVIPGENEDKEPTPGESEDKNPPLPEVPDRDPNPEVPSLPSDENTPNKDDNLMPDGETPPADIIDPPLREPEYTQNPIEVVVPKTSKSSLNIIFLLLSLISLMYIKHAK